MTCLSLGRISASGRRLTGGALTVMVSLWLGSACDETSPPAPTPLATTTHIVRDVDYSDRFFYFDHPLVFVGMNLASVFDLYRLVTPQEIQENPGINRFPAVAFVDSGGFGTDIDMAMRRIANGRSAAKANLRSDVQLLEFGVDYLFILVEQRVVGVELQQPLDPLQSLAVRYTNTAGKKIGGQYSDYGINVDFMSQETDTLVLELLFGGSALTRPDNQFGWLWSYAARAYYELGFNDIDPSALSISIVDQLTSRSDRTRPEGSTVRYLRIFGLDYTNADGSTGPNGSIDLIRVDYKRGLLHFPMELRVAPDSATAANYVLDAHVPLQGFAPAADSVAIWTDGQFAFTGAYQVQWDQARRIYSEFLNSADLEAASQYLIRATRFEEP